MTDLIDYSRPVGWWCPVCTRCAQLDRADDLIKLGLLNCCPSLPVIPRYLPIPEGQRPPAASEVEEAEVVTWCGSGNASDMYAWRGVSGAVVGPLTLDEYAGLVVYAQHADHGTVDIKTFGPNSIYDNRAVPYNANGAPMTWRYPTHCKDTIDAGEDGCVVVKDEGEA